MQSMLSIMEYTMPHIIMARAPVRNADLGGWRDTRLFSSGKVLNMAIRLYTYVSLVPMKEKGIRIESHDIGGTEYIRNLRDIEYAGTLGLLKAAVGSSGARGGFKLIVRSEAPPASGLGSSAALAVAVLGALYRYQGKNLLPHHIAMNAQRLETELLGLECGVQDQFCAAYGGINYMDVRYPDAHVLPVPVSDGFLCALEASLLVVYTGKSHFSSATHQKVIEEYEKKNPRVMGAFDRLARTAAVGMDALLKGSLQELAGATNDNWEQQKLLHPSITTPEVENLRTSVFTHGALGFKLNGAGAGGTATVICAPDRTHEVEKMIRTTFPVMTIMNAKLDFGRCQGLQVWERENGRSEKEDVKRKA